MDLKTLDVFLDVARAGSFAAVAHARDLDPSSVSRAIADLETDLGVRLFQRSTRRLALTEAGDVFLGRVEPLAEELRRARDAAVQVSGAPRGRLRLTASVTFGQRCLLPRLPEFRRRYPDLALECLFTDANLDLVADRIDLAVRLAPAIEGDLVASKLMDTRYRVVAAPAYLDRSPPLERPADLQAHRCLRFTLGAYRTRWLFRDAQGAIETVPVDGDLTLSPAGALREAALLGLGPALLPDWLIDEDLAGGRLRQLFPGWAATATTFDTAAWAVYPSRAFLPQKVRVAIDFLRESLAAQASSK
ncbi:MAG: LysR family transcriptional regulator [Steroidobacteraceae bacterium]|jgi:DNA-binding transcriptional LysR family regulator|nr:LysR family transcriptional regulator [Steroidobacteraceae bacterium]